MFQRLYRLAEGEYGVVIYRLFSGDCVHRYSKSIVIILKGKRKVLSTSPLNGGYRENLNAVFNNDGNPGAGMACKLLAPTYEEHMSLIASGLGLDPDKTAGISTAASMDNVSIKSEAFEDLTVTAIVTGGVEVNGGRVGDPASYHERKGQADMLKQGTINILLAIDANLSEGALARALVTCTEAKTAALQELMAGSNYSCGLATGSGTDGTIVVSNAESGLFLTNAGKHSKLGELIGHTVKSAVKEALFLQTKLCPQYQHSILRRMKRYGITEEAIWDRWQRNKNRGDSPAGLAAAECSQEKGDGPAELAITECSREEGDNPVELAVVKCSQEEGDSPAGLAAAECSQEKGDSPAGLAVVKCSREDGDGPAELVVTECSQEEGDSPVELAIAKCTQGDGKSSITVSVEDCPDKKMGRVEDCPHSRQQVIVEECPRKCTHKADFIDRLHGIDGDGMLVTLTSLYAHLLDQLEWGLLSGPEVEEEAKQIVFRIQKKLGLHILWKEIGCRTTEELMKGLVENFTAWMAEVAGGKEDV